MSAKLMGMVWELDLDHNSNPSCSPSPIMPMTMARDATPALTTSHGRPAMTGAVSSASSACLKQPT